MSTTSTAPARIAEVFIDELTDHTAVVYASKSLQPSTGHGPYDVLKTFRSWDEARLFYLTLYDQKEREGYKYLELELAPSGVLGSQEHRFPHIPATCSQYFGRKTICHWTVHEGNVQPKDVYDCKEHPIH